MVEQYPDSIVITVQPDAVQDPASGTYSVPTGTNTVYTFGCRAEQNGRNGQIAGKDGTMIDYSYTVYMPRTTVDIPWESPCVLTIGTKTVQGKVKGASNGQMNSRLWL